MIYESRVYHAMPGRLPDLLARFQNTTLAMWEKYDIHQVAFFTTVVGDSNNDLSYLLAWESMAEREQKWSAFQSDPDWIAARTATEQNGQIVESISNSFLAPTAFSALR